MDRTMTERTPRRMAEIIERIRTERPQVEPVAGISREMMQAGLERERQSAAQAQARADLSFAGEMPWCRFDSLRDLDVSQRQAIEICHSFRDGWRELDRGFALHGTTGVGKSHCLRALANELAETEHPPRMVYVRCAELAKITTKLRYELDERIQASQVVFFDDVEKALGGSAPPWAGNTIKTAFELVDSTKRPLVVMTSNHSLAEHKAALAEWLYGRFAQHLDWHEVIGINWRVREAEERAPWWSK